MLLAGLGSFGFSANAETKIAEIDTDQQMDTKIPLGDREFRITRNGLISQKGKGAPSKETAQIKLEKGELITRVQLAELSDGVLLLGIASDGESYSGTLLKLSPQLKVIWKANVGVINPLPMLVSKDSIFIADSSATTKVDLKTGKIIWTVEPMPDEFLGGTQLTGIALAPKHIIVQAQANQVGLQGPIELHLNEATGKQVKIVKAKPRK